MGLLPVFDPRIDPEVEGRILGYVDLEAKLRNLDGDVVWPGRGVSCEEDAIAEVEKMRAAGVCGIIYFAAWFLHNVIVGACQHSGLPALVWSIPNLDNASLIGFGVTHGSLG